MDKVCLLTPYSMVQDSHSACQTIASFLYGIRRLITILTKAHHRTLSWACRIQFALSIPVSSQRSILMLSFLVVSSFRASEPKFCKHFSPSPPLYASHMSSSPHPHPNNIRWRIQAAKFIIMQFFPISFYLPFRSKYPPQHPVLRNSQFKFLFHCLRHAKESAQVRSALKNFSGNYFFTVRGC